MLRGAGNLGQEDRGLATVVLFIQDGGDTISSGLSAGDKAQLAIWGAGEERGEETWGHFTTGNNNNNYIATTSPMWSHVIWILPLDPMMV